MKKTIALSTTLVLLNFGFQTSRTYGQAGSLDLTFSADGKVTTAIGGVDQGRAVAIQSDGKIVVAGNSSGFAVARYLTDGSLDVTFDTDGKVTTAVGTGTSARGNAIAIQTDGKILVAGYASNGSDNDYAVVRYNSNGSLDNTFGTGGIVTTPIGILADEIYAMTLQTDGKIIVVGKSNVNTTVHFSIARYNTNGTLDTSFDGDGFAITTGTFGEAKGVAVQTNGKIIVAGQFDFTLVRYNTNGSLDLTFDFDGILQNPGLFMSPTCMVLQSDGKIVVAGSSNNDFAVVRYNSAGTIDNSFGTGGMVTTPIGAADDFALSIALQSNGKIVVSGYSDNGTDNDFALVRYNSNGTLDNLFDTDGIVTTAMGLTGNDDGNSIAIQPSDGAIVVAGYATVSASVDFAIARYIGVCPVPSNPGTITGNSATCINSSNTYSISSVAGATGYTWSVPSGAVINSGQGTTSINVTFGTTSGNVSVTANNSCGPSSPQTLAVNLVTVLSAPGTISGTTSVCAGSNNTYSISAVAGATGYTWTVPTGTVINSGQNTTSITVTAGTNSGNITVTANNACGQSTPQTLLVTNVGPPQPGPIAGTTATCGGASQTYSIAAVSGASGYVWTVPAGSTITSGQGTTSITVTFGSATGNVTVASSNSCGNSTPQTISVNVTVVPAMPGTISGNLNVCPGTANVSYSISAVSGANGYTWSVPPGSVINFGQNTTGINVTFGSTPGPITVTANNSCGASSAQSTPTMIDVPYSFFNYTAVGLAVTFGNLCANANTYSWLFGDGGFSAAPSPVHNYPASGTYTVELTATGACGSHYYTKNISITDSTNSDDVSVEELENLFHVGMYPNPTNGKFKIQVDGENAPGNENFMVIVLNYAGQIVYQKELNNKESEIDLSNCSNGMYFVKCVFDSGECMMKLVKE